MLRSGGDRGEGGRGEWGAASPAKGMRSSLSGLGVGGSSSQFERRLEPRDDLRGKRTGKNQTGLGWTAAQQWDSGFELGAGLDSAGPMGGGGQFLAGENGCDGVTVPHLRDPGWPG